MATDIPGLGKAPSSAAGRPLERMREELQILLGTRGDPLDAALTLRSAIERGLIDRIGNALGGSVTYVNTFPTTTVSGVDPTPDLTPPPTVAGLTVQAGFSQIIVQFTAPTYTQGHGNLQTNIYAVKKDPSDPTLPTFTAGVTPLVTAAPGALNIVSIPSELNTRWHVWAKHQTVDGVESVAVAGGVNGYNVAGAYPTTGQDIAQLLEILSGSITESELYSTLNTRINLIDDASGVAGSVNARLLSEATARGTAIGVETTNRGIALADLSAVKSRTFYSGTAPVSDGSYTLQANDVWYNTADSNKPYVYTGGSWVAAPDARVGLAVTAIATETTDRATADTAEVAARESLYAGFGGASGTDYKVFNQAAEPAGTTIGDVWSWKTGGGAETFSRWNGASWTDSAANRRAAVYRGEYADASALPATGSVIGDLARQTDTNGVVVWNGSAWAAKTSLPAPVYAFVEKESRSRADAVTAEALVRESLAVQLRGEDTGTNVTTLTAGLIYSEREARITSVGVQASRVDALVLSVDTPGTGLLARASSLETVTLSITDPTIGNAALAERADLLEVSVNTPSTGLLARATALESTVIDIGEDTGVLASSVSLLSAAVQKASLGLPFTSWNLDGQSIVTIADGKVGNTALRLVGPVGGYPNQGNHIPIDRTKTYRVRFWARPVVATGLLYFSLRQFVDGAGTPGPDNGGRSPYKPGGQNRSDHNIQFGGTDQWGEYSYTWDSADWQAGVQFVQPEFLDNYPDASGYWEVQDFSFEEVTDFENLSASVTDIETVVLDGVSGVVATAGKVTTLQSQMTGATDSILKAAIEAEALTRAEETGDLFAQYTVKIDLNGYMSGYGLMSSLTSGGAPTSTFIVSVDKFAVASPATSIPTWSSGVFIGINEIRGVTGYADKVLVCKTPGYTSGSQPDISSAIGSTLQDGGVSWQIASSVPFAVLTVPTTVNGVSLAAGVYIDAAYVLNGTIKKSQLGDAIIDDAKVIDLSASKLLTGSLAVGADISSSGFVAGVSGWRIQGDGNAEFQNGTFRGTVYASAGVFAGSLSAATGTFAGSLSAATGTFAGDISAATGTFSGSLNVNSGGSTRMEITSSLIRGYNSGVLRFELSV